MSHRDDEPAPCAAEDVAAPPLAVATTPLKQAAALAIQAFAAKAHPTPLKTLPANEPIPDPSRRRRRQNRRPQEMAWTRIESRW